MVRLVTAAKIAILCVGALLALSLGLAALFGACIGEAWCFMQVAQHHDPFWWGIGMGIFLLDVAALLFIAQCIVG